MRLNLVLHVGQKEAFVLANVGHEGGFRTDVGC